MNKLCSVLVEVASKQQEESVLAEATFLAHKFTKAFNLFGACHSLYNKALLDDEDITNIGKFSHLGNNYMYMTVK